MDVRPLPSRQWIPFVVVMGIATAAIVGLSVREGLSGWRVAAVALLGAAALVLHAAFLRRGGGKRPWAFLAPQAGLALAVGAASGAPIFGLVLSMAVLGEAVGALPRPQALGLAVSLVAGLFAQGWLVQGSVPLNLMVAVPIAVGVAFYVEMYQRQARERQKTQDALRELDEAHQELAKRAARIEELTLAAERQRMARELHDTLAQGLAGLVLQLEALDARLQKGDLERARSILEKGRERARAALAEARRAIDDLRTSGSESLSQAVRSEVERFQAATGIACELSLPDGLRLPAASAEHAVRCVSESLMNCARHAAAKHVRVVAEVRGPTLALTVEDDGKGFDPVAVEGLAGHYGLLGLRERARVAGGTLSIDSGPGKGTRVRLEFTAATEARR